MHWNRNPIHSMHFHRNKFRSAQRITGEGYSTERQGNETEITNESCCSGKQSSTPTSGKDDKTLAQLQPAQLLLVQKKKKSVVALNAPSKEDSKTASGNAGNSLQNKLQHLPVQWNPKHLFFQRKCRPHNLTCCKIKNPTSDNTVKSTSSPVAKQGNSLLLQIHGWSIRYKTASTGNERQPAKEYRNRLPRRSHQLLKTKTTRPGETQQEEKQLWWTSSRRRRNNFWQMRHRWMPEQTQWFLLSPLLFPKKRFSILLRSRSILSRTRYRLNPELPLRVGMVFKVQIGAFHSPLPADAFKNLQPITGETTRPGWIRYCMDYSVHLKLRTCWSLRWNQAGTRMLTWWRITTGRELNCRRPMHLSGIWNRCQEAVRKQ